MKTKITATFAIIAATLAWQAEAQTNEIKFDSLTVKEVTYTNCSLAIRNPSEGTVFFDGGAARIKLKDLSEPYRSRFFDESKATAFEQSQAEKKAAMKAKSEAAAAQASVLKQYERFSPVGELVLDPYDAQSSVLKQYERGLKVQKDEQEHRRRMNRLHEELELSQAKTEPQRWAIQDRYRQNEIQILEAELNQEIRNLESLQKALPLEQARLKREIEAIVKNPEYVSPGDIKIIEAKLAEDKERLAEYIKEPGPGKKSQAQKDLETIIRLEKKKEALAERNTKNKPEAKAANLKFNQELAAKGDPYGLLRMGERYLTGDGVEKDESKAREYFKQAAAQGVSEAAAILEKMKSP